jgi:hypothetical protein
MVGVDEECLHICIDWKQWKARRQKGELPEGAFPHDFTHYVFYYPHYVPRRR